MNEQRVNEIAATAVTNQHGVERDDTMWLVGEVRRLWGDLQASRGDALKLRGLLEEAGARESELKQLAVEQAEAIDGASRELESRNQERDAIVAFLRKLDMRHVAASIQDGKHLEAT